MPRHEVRTTEVWRVDPSCRRLQLQPQPRETRARQVAIEASKILYPRAIFLLVWFYNIDKQLLLTRDRPSES